MIMRFLMQTDDNYDGHLPQKRAFERRNQDQCVSEIGGKNYPVINWSQGGVLLQVDDRKFAQGEEYDVHMKFHIQDQIVDIRHKALVVRKGMQRIALKFLPLTDTIRRNFQQVIDDSMAREFADSQT